MKKGKGFTLVELLAVIVILAIVLIIAVPGVLSIINKTKDNAYDRQLDMIKEATRMYIAAEAKHINWNGTEDKTTVVTLDMLKSSGYLDKKIVDPRDKKEILCANVLVMKDRNNKLTYDVDASCNAVLPINPRLGSGMIPIVYQKDKWVKADASNQNFGWFNYGNQQWANVAMVNDAVRDTYLNATVGTEIPLDQIQAMFTWIPRFKYKLFNVDGSISPIGNKNLAEDQMVDIQFETKGTAKSTGTKNGQWLTHPAFTLNGQELDGFWFGKFETGLLGASTIGEAEQNIVDPTKLIVKPNTFAWRGIQPATMYQNVTGLVRDRNLFGVTDTEDPHVMKNMEWGAMAYLTYSRYGKSGNPNYHGDEKQVRINNQVDHVTGCGADRQNGGVAAICYTYDTVNGLAASTTGNITGVYDTAGGSWEYVMGVMKTADGTAIVKDSGFEQTELNQLGQAGIYLELYEPGVSSDYSRGHLGDATLELGPFEGERSSWYQDRAVMVDQTYPWFVRGGSSGNGGNSGTMTFAYDSGRMSDTFGYRLILI